MEVDNDTAIKLGLHYTSHLFTPQILTIRWRKRIIDAQWRVQEIVGRYKWQ